MIYVPKTNPSLYIPCLTSEKRKEEKESTSLSTVDKVMLIACPVFVILGFILATQFPFFTAAVMLGGISIIAGGISGLYVSISQIIKIIRKDSASDEDSIQKLEKLEAGKHLANGIVVSQDVVDSLTNFIPSIDYMNVDDDAIKSVHYNKDNTATFTLNGVLGLQFRVCPPSNSGTGCEEFRLRRRYQNMVYAQEICNRKNYNFLFVPPVKPLYLTINGRERTLLAESVVVKTDSTPAQTFEPAIRQMVQFLVQTGGWGISDPIPFTPTEGGKLALQNVRHLLDTAHDDKATRTFLETGAILNEEHSLLASLDQEDLIDIALKELENLRPIKYYIDETEEGKEAQSKTISDAKTKRMAKLSTPVVTAPITEAKPPNRLGITATDLAAELDLEQRDYAVIRKDGVRSDGECRIITLKEVAQAIINLINRKLSENPQSAEIIFTPEDMLIGKTLPSNLEMHNQYNTLQGLGYKGWPNPNEEPPYWIALIFEALKARGCIQEFSLPERSNPRLVVSEEALLRAKSA